MDAGEFTLDGQTFRIVDGTVYDESNQPCGHVDPTGPAGPTGAPGPVSDKDGPVGAYDFSAGNGITGCQGDPRIVVVKPTSMGTTEAAIHAAFRKLYGASRNKKQSEKPRETTTMQPFRREKLPGRNDPCPCGSGKKAKRCCLDKIKWLASLPPDLRRSVIVNKIMRRPNALPPVPANVLASDGSPVKGVTFKDATLYVDGVAVPVTNAEMVPATTATVETATTPDATTG